MRQPIGRDTSNQAVHAVLGTDAVGCFEPSERGLPLMWTSYMPSIGRNFSSSETVARELHRTMGMSARLEMLYLSIAVCRKPKSLPCSFIEAIDT